MNFLVRLVLVIFFAMGSAWPMSYEEAVHSYERLYEERMNDLKEGSRPFFLGQGYKTKTVVLFHGLSDSPGSMREVGNVYFENGFNVLALLLRDHGLNKKLRHKARKEVTLKGWREDADKVIELALQMSDNSKIALAGYSLGGALALDAADRYRADVSSLVLIAPMFKMMYSALTPLTGLLRHVIYSTKKGIDETAHFYPDIALNQTFHASKLTRHLKKNVICRPQKSLLNLPKMMFLTDADTTIKNKFALKVAKRINIQDVVIYKNEHKNKTVLHRDLPVREINASQLENPHLDDLLQKTREFLQGQSL